MLAVEVEQMVAVAASLADERTASVQTYLGAVRNFAPARLGFKYNMVEAFVQDEGKPTSTEPFTPDEEAFLLRLFSAWNRPARAGACFETATRLTILARPEAGMDVAYGEGYGSTGIIPVMHAVMLLNGKAVDLTWHERLAGRAAVSENKVRAPAKLLERAKYNLANHGYVMVSFTTADLLPLLLAKRTYGVLDDWEHGWPLLRDGHPRDANG